MTASERVSPRRRKAGTKQAPLRQRPAARAPGLDIDTGAGREAAELSYTDRAYHELEERIVTLSLAPGSVLSEQGLANDLKIGRTPIREALQRLARDGLVTVLPRRGILVSAINLETQLKLLEVRRELERLMAKLAAERADETQRHAFAEIAKGMLAAADKSDDRAFMRLDQKFNALIAAASRNEFATRSMGLMNGLSRRFWYQHYKQAADLPHAAKLHAHVANAVSRGQPDAAAKASDDLVAYIESFARKTLHFGG